MHVSPQITQFLPKLLFCHTCCQHAQNPTGYFYIINTVIDFGPFFLETGVFILLSNVILQLRVKSDLQLHYTKWISSMFV